MKKLNVNVNIEIDLPDNFLDFTSDCCMNLGFEKNSEGELELSEYEDDEYKQVKKVIVNFSKDKNYRVQSFYDYSMD